MSKKRKLQEFETVKLTEECSAILQKKLPQKLKDPGSFTILCIIGSTHVNKALCDLGASINLMPFSIYRDLELGEVKPTTINFQLADRSLTYPRGIVEDVLVKVDKFIFPADFVILDMEEDQDAPLIFGATLLSHWKSIDRCHTVEDPLERFFSSTVGRVDDDDWELREKLLALEELPKVKEVAQEKLEEQKCSEIIPSSPVLKELPSHLCYAFLGEKSTYPWISPTICMHRILMEKSYAPYVDHHRRLNPAMKEVVKNEVLKLLNAGVISAISDSSWVSLVQVVPKKGGMTVVKNENDELISTRTVTGWRTCWLLSLLFLESYSGYNQIAIAPEDQEKTTFTCPYGTFAFRRMPFGDVKKNLALNWKKCHFMVQEGIVLGHKVYSKGLEAFEKIKKALVIAQIMIVPYCKEPLKLMCDASVYTVGVVLGQRRDKFFRSIYYASRTMDTAQQNYTTTEKEMLAVVFAFDKFRPYLVGTKDRKGYENEVPDHLSWLELEDKIDEVIIKEAFLDEQLLRAIKKYNAKFYLWDDPYAFKICADQIIRRCVAEEEAKVILDNATFHHVAATLEHQEQQQRYYSLVIIGLLCSKIVIPQPSHVTDAKAIATNTYDARIVAKFVHRNIFTRFGTPRAIISDEELEHRAFWALKKLNFDMEASGEQRLLQLNEMEEFINEAYENAKIYKEKTRSGTTTISCIEISSPDNKYCCSIRASNYFLD
ncbi:uncharacterized protein [Primulina eburnea]|uniref:uncharacterized protein n=1 Tax=Primulina eburnea TaxID=1245227 RepID=UPI003C6C44FF